MFILPNGRSYQRLLLGAWLGVACAAAGPETPSSANAATLTPPLAAAPRAAALARVRGGAVVSASTAARVAMLWEVAAGGQGRAVAASRSARLVAYSSGVTVRLYGIDHGEQKGEFTPCSEVLRGGLAFHGKSVVVACSDRIAVYDAKKKKLLKRLDTSESPITAVAFQGDWVAAGHRDGVIRIYSLVGSKTREVVVPGPPIDVKSLALSPGGKHVVVAWVQGSIWWWSLSEPDVSQKLARYAHESDAVAFNAEGTLLVEEGESQQTTVWKFGNDAKPFARLRHGAWLKRLLFTPDQKWLVRAGSDGIELAEIDGPRRVELDSRAPVEDASFDENARLIAAADRAGRLIVFGVKR